jgi:hypothetical protein
VRADLMGVEKADHRFPSGGRGGCLDALCFGECTQRSGPNRCWEGFATMDFVAQKTIDLQSFCCFFATYRRR